MLILDKFEPLVPEDFKVLIFLNFVDFKLNNLKSLINKFEYFFSEDQGRYVVEVSKKNLQKVENILKENSVHFDLLGEVQKDNFLYVDEEKISVDELSKHNKNWLMEYMVQ